MTKFGIENRLATARLLLAAFLVALGAAGIVAGQSTKDGTTKTQDSEVQESKKATKAQSEAEAPVGQVPVNTAPSAGLKVVRDPETGKLRGPDRAEAAKMSGPAMNRSIEGLQAVQLPGGVTVVDLQGRFQSYSVATKKPGGGIEIECHSTEPGHSHAASANSDANANPTENRR